jgi:hypothetical protein
MPILFLDQIRFLRRTSGIAKLGRYLYWNKMGRAYMSRPWIQRGSVVLLELEISSKILLVSLFGRFLGNDNETVLKNGTRVNDKILFFILHAFSFFLCEKGV